MKNNMLLLRQLILILLVLPCLMASASDAVRIGIAWQPNDMAYDRVVKSIIIAGAQPVILQQVRPAGFDYENGLIHARHLDSNGVLKQEYADIVKHNTWNGSNAATTLEYIDAVVFLGGGDISSTLFREPQPWHGITEDNNCDATRDVSEYLTMAYCLDHDIPVLGLCRGMQMLAVVSGADMIQDLKSYYDARNICYDHLHRSLRDEKGNRHYVPHDVIITNHNSLLYSITQSDTVKNVPSWHHQAVGDVKGTNLAVTGITPTQGIDIIEAIERTDKTFALGVQYHPEEAVRKHIYNDPEANQFMQLYKAVNYFRALIGHCKTK